VPFGWILTAADDARLLLAVGGLTLLNETLFTSLAHVREALAIGKDDYNTFRPHSALGNLPPAVYARISAPEMQRDGTLRYIEGSAG
jgi:putative transposase